MSNEYEFIKGTIIEIKDNIIKVENAKGSITYVDFSLINKEIKLFDYIDLVCVTDVYKAIKVNTAKKSYNKTDFERQVISFILNFRLVNNLSNDDFLIVEGCQEINRMLKLDKISHKDIRDIIQFAASNEKYYKYLYKPKLLRKNYNFLFYQQLKQREHEYFSNKNKKYKV